MENKNRRWKLLGLSVLIILLALAYKWAELEKNKETVSITSISGVNMEGGDGYIKVTLEPKLGKAFVIGGWKLALGEQVIPLPNASALPYQGRLNEEKPVTLTLSTTLVISPGRSPLGVSFRENRCIGMLGYFQTFIPPLPPACEQCTEETSASPSDVVKYPDYNSCVDNHRGESDFFGSTWRMYLATDTDWTTRHKVVRLYNESNKLLDTLSY
ncbi:MAG: hypothetical protein A2749_03250 [Parcubacteria group bacterium RIFCSPHIGHO2_01_FULL_45_26]|nr:MAG: hypothetical protein A2749_03250 [Parcubacteria group bacterium RIFCSPHIGHO2_01_FULL_45_26]